MHSLSLQISSWDRVSARNEEIHPGIEEKTGYWTSQVKISWKYSLNGMCIILQSNKVYANVIFILKQDCCWFIEFFKCSEQ